MSIYSIDYNDLNIKTLPPDKRGPFMRAWLKALMTPLQYLRDLFLGDYISGSTAAFYASGTYNQGDRVRFWDNAIYESLIDSNTDAPTTANWRKVLDTFIGVNERLLYTGQVIVLEYALNKWFNTTFRQPGGSHSDIYLSKVPYLVPVFRVAGDEADSSSVYNNTSSEFVINSYSFTSSASFIINMPLSLYNSLNSDAANRDKIVRGIADKYVAAGITYNIQTY